MRLAWRKRLLAYFFKIPHKPLGARERSFRNLGLWENKGISYEQASKKLYEIHLNYLKPTAGKKLLELACGTGYQLEELVERFELSCADGIDLQADLELAKPPNVHLSNQDLRSISAAQVRDYDYLLCVDASYHFLKSQTPLAGCMKANARFVVSCLAAHPPKGSAKLYFYLILAGLRLFRIAPIFVQSKRLFGGLKIEQTVDLTDSVLGGFSRFYLRRRPSFSFKVFLSALLCRFLASLPYFSYRLLVVKKD